MSAIERLGEISLEAIKQLQSENERLKVQMAAMAKAHGELHNQNELLEQALQKLEGERDEFTIDWGYETRSLDTEIVGGEWKYFYNGQWCTMMEVFNHFKQSKQNDNTKIERE